MGSPHPGGVTVDDLTVRYGDRDALSGMSFQVERGEFMTFLGPSGCGKSTLLRTIAGLVDATSGSITINGEEVTALPPEDRHLGFVFQSYALFPHLNVAQNVAYGLRAQRLPRREIPERVGEALAITGLEDLREATPARLSGGQQQRVAIARVLATRPSVLLMDEPLSNLDAVLRVRLRDEIRALHDRIGITTLYVTHDQEEALSMSDRIAVMNHGRFSQVAAPETLYSDPADAYTCEFIGESTKLDLHMAAVFGITPTAGVNLYVRPEHVHLGSPADQAAGEVYSAVGQIRQRTYLGASSRMIVRVGGGDIVARPGGQAAARWATGDPVRCTVRKEDLLWLS
ncbi:putative spermidine/putrescine transport system ATP-binding protein [Leifsonia sp. 98AMF]|uniref:ABC transporter ATP-binding protein n=1 Tax=unclassified Leifsonia TaxID=2663824 RepID=UPI00087B05E4|nr:MULTISPECIES: ABC transporter ATP-binding protein [unclassified Leifsonia]SDH61840.1 putative spermidine/putrescine transport system ATP-binding protein [Leifsonia sp. 197AMF]SDI77284.1 putative spermidine/putrescine transport system ATP-binding protein [Leifsonia sp. 466MF]SDK09607.1 putative spermidine/putrescine transport system ATP-binding protein [Leifsonia sp. 157MF]SDN80683.1 putative spermidine/putrescine transport system ATP-binding protein [Leifsonia sp. 509MF]SEN26730.1 putative 